MVVYIDIDETICGYNPPEDRDYNKAIPNIPNIIKANKKEKKKSLKIS